jgi:hypothetical protein
MFTVMLSNAPASLLGLERVSPTPVEIGGHAFVPTFIVRSFPRSYITAADTVQNI